MSSSNSQPKKVRKPRKTKEIVDNSNSLVNNEIKNEVIEEKKNTKKERS